MYDRGPDRRSVDAGVWGYGLTDVELSALTAALAVEEMETQWARAKPPEQRDGIIG